jgi:hypothetical protein
LLLLFYITLSSKKCPKGESNPPPPGSTTSCRVFLTYPWYINPGTSGCQHPSFGNDPRYDSGVCSEQDATKRFTQIKVRNITTGAIQTFCWSNAVSYLDIQVPSSNPFGVVFSQTDKCRNCFQILTQQGIKDTRLIWSNSKTFNLAVTTITMSPSYANQYSVCQ